MIDAYPNGELTQDLSTADGLEGEAGRGLRREEKAVLDFLRRGEAAVSPQPVKPVFDGAGEPSGDDLVTSRPGDHAEDEVPRGDKSTYSDRRGREAGRSALARKAAATRQRIAEQAHHD